VAKLRLARAASGDYRRPGTVVTAGPCLVFSVLTGDQKQPLKRLSANGLLSAKNYDRGLMCDRGKFPRRQMFVQSGLLVGEGFEEPCQQSCEKYIMGFRGGRPAPKNAEKEFRGILRDATGKLQPWMLFSQTI